MWEALRTSDVLYDKEALAQRLEAAHGLNGVGPGRAAVRDVCHDGLDVPANHPPCVSTLMHSLHEGVYPYHKTRIFLARYLKSMGVSEPEHRAFWRNHLPSTTSTTAFAKVYDNDAAYAYRGCTNATVCRFEERCTFRTTDNSSIRDMCTTIYGLDSVHSTTIGGRHQQSLNDQVDRKSWASLCSLLRTYVHKTPWTPINRPSDFYAPTFKMNDDDDEMERLMASIDMTYFNM